MTVANRQRSKSAGTPSRAAAAEADVRIPASEAGAVRGGVSIAESVVEMIAATAAGDVPGIYPGNGPGGITSELSRALVRVRMAYGQGSSTTGKSVSR